MQQILNKSERTQAFLKFLLFFVITVILVVTAIYFNYRVPVKENKWLKQQEEVQREHEGAQTKFIAKMNEAVALLDSLTKPGVNTEIVGNDLSAALMDLRKLQQDEKTQFGKMNRVIIEKFSILKSELIKSKGSEGNTTEIMKLRADMRDCENKNLALLKTLNGSNE